MSFLRPATQRSASTFVPKQFCRCASLDSIIYKGIRREAREESRSFDRSRDTRIRDSDRYRDRNDPSPANQERYTPIRHIDPYSDDANYRYSRTPRRTTQKVNQDSEWIYGTSVVEAALKSHRRTLYRLYVYAGENRTTISKERDIKLKNLARGLKIDIKEVTDAGILDSMSSSRPHNGYVLEASPIKKTPILSLGAVSYDKSTFSLQIAQHDITNSRIVLNDLPKTVPNRDPSRYPLVLMLDEILDPGNLGAILRTAYYLGCSALLVAERNCAPLSPACLKSSAGASEYMPILTQTVPQRLIANSQAHGWKFFAAVPQPTKSKKGKNYLSLESDEVKEALKTGPTVVVMGGEADGLRTNVERACDRCVSIRGASDVDQGVDSLNVSVAAGVLCQAFLMER
ncbi:Alpha/beta knot methyltransferase [Trichophaea hybrida]|nr:Alpha/beta knot methyltransferase [Trichophaea hybrida]